LYAGVRRGSRFGLLLLLYLRNFPILLRHFEFINEEINEAGFADARRSTHHDVEIGHISGFGDLVFRIC